VLVIAATGKSIVLHVAVIANLPFWFCWNKTWNESIVL